jgi:hypothetical protein
MSNSYDYSYNTNTARTYREYLDPRGDYFVRSSQCAYNQPLVRPFTGPAPARLGAALTGSAGDDRSESCRSLGNRKNNSPPMSGFGRRQNPEGEQLLTLSS